jgi:hypothetical protein
LGVTSEFRYPEAHVSILAVSPPLKERTLLKDAEGREVDMIMLSQRLGKSAYQTVGFSNRGSPFVNPSKSVISIVNAGLAGSGAIATTHAVSDIWRGHVSATISGSAQTSEGKFFVTVRVVEVRELDGVIQFITVSDISAAEAMSLREMLEASTNIIESDSH